MAMSLISSQLPHGLLLSLNAIDYDKVRFVVAHLYLYKVLVKEPKFGVLCSKEKYMFFRRVENLIEKILLILRTYWHHSSML